MMILKVKIIRLFTFSDETPKINDFISVGLKDEKKKTVIQYVGQIIDVIQDRKTYDVNYLRNYRDHTDIFTFSELDDESLVYFFLNIDILLLIVCTRKEILKKISNPCSILSLFH